ncbi:hypothetical protein EVAR_80868_1 [Eumeta japonica]|uniref:Uncharacterized protein n=1 Tax=Eumeta variegata TaxID=151549 RepID=A0A4C1V1F3_EUMVA|nr:hypothetical protein EVAR_80868_1 [Eumeta japonica]
MFNNLKTTSVQVLPRYTVRVALGPDWPGVEDLKFKRYGHSYEYFKCQNFRVEAARNKNTAVGHVPYVVGRHAQTPAHRTRVARAAPSSSVSSRKPPP